MAEKIRITNSSNATIDLGKVVIPARSSKRFTEKQLQDMGLEVRSLEDYKRKGISFSVVTGKGADESASLEEKGLNEDGTEIVTPPADEPAAEEAKEEVKEEETKEEDAEGSAGDADGEGQQEEESAEDKKE